MVLEDKRNWYQDDSSKSLTSTNKPKRGIRSFSLPCLC